MNTMTWKSTRSRRRPYCGETPSSSSLLRCFGGLMLVALAASCGGGGGGGIEGAAPAPQ